jgi:hypothetical protein
MDVMIRTLMAIGFGAAVLLRGADDPKQFVEMTHTERVDFPAGGTLRLPNSSGMLTVEAWDQPGIEITTIKTVSDAAGDREKATHDVEDHQVKVERRGDEVVITANASRYSTLGLEYRIKAPATAKLVVSHFRGQVTVDGMASDIDIHLRDGDILLHLPEGGAYKVSAKCGIGSVDSDLPGAGKRIWFFGQRIESADSSAQPHKLNLKVGVGDIIILKTRVPKPSAFGF